MIARYERTKSSVAFSVAPPFGDVVVPFVTRICAGSAATSLESRNGFLDTGPTASGPVTGLVEPGPTLLRKGLLEARGEETRSVGELVALCAEQACARFIRAVAATVLRFDAGWRSDQTLVHFLCHNVYDRRKLAELTRPNLYSRHGGVC